MATGSLSAWRLQPEASTDEVDSWFDEDGRLLKAAEMRRALFRVGVAPSCRRRLWKYLFGIYEPSFAYRDQRIVDVENHVQYEALKKRWKVLDDTVAMTKDDLYTSPAYMVDSDEEGEDSSPSLHREDSHLSQLSGRKVNLGDGDDDSFCILPTPPLEDSKLPNGDLYGTHHSDPSNAPTGGNNSAPSPMDPAHVSSKRGGALPNGHHGDDSTGTNINSDVIITSDERPVDHGTAQRKCSGDGGGGRSEGDVGVQGSRPSSCAQCCDRSEDEVVEGEGQVLVGVLEVAAKVYAARHRVGTLASYSQSRRTILRDVARTDRQNHYFSHKRNLRKVHRILMIYALFHPEVGYCQGMNDILAVFLLVVHSEVEAYWMFCTYMKDKQLDEDPTLGRIELVKRVLMEEDREMGTFLEGSECCEMLFCHKWLLVDFKREFEAQDAIHMYEAIRCHNMETSALSPTGESGHFQLCVCVAILVIHRDQICTKNDAVSIYSTINQLAMRMNLTDVLSKAAIIFNKHSKKVFEFI